MKKGDRYIVDFCSPWGKQFFDLHRLWKVWGVDLIENNLIGQAPRQAFIGLLIGGAATVLSVVAGFLAFWSYWGALLATLCAWIATVTTVSSAAFSNAFVNRLASTSSKLKHTGTGTIVVHSGNSYLYTIWIAAAISLFGALTWSFTSWRKRSTRSKSVADKLHPEGYVGIIRRTTGELFGKMSGRDTKSYKHISAGHEITELHSRDGSQIGLIPRQRSMPLEALHESLHGSSRGRDTSHNIKGMNADDEGDIAYEPLRHRELPG